MISRMLPPVTLSLLFAAFVALLASMGPDALMDPDTLWHLAAGDEIRALGRIPEADSWSYTANGFPWLNISWAWDVVISWIYQHTGWQGAVTFGAVCLGLTLTLVVAFARMRGAEAAAIMLALLLVIQSLVISLRTHQMTYLFAVLSALLLWRAARGNARLLLWLPVITVIWANTHGGFLLLYTLLGAYGVQALLQRQWRWAGILAATGVICLLAPLAHPLGWDAWVGTLRLLAPASQNLVGEWMPLKLRLSSLLLQYAAIPVFLLLVRPRDPQFSCAEKIICYLWLVMALGSQRHYMVFVLLSSPLIAQALQGVLAGKKEPQRAWPPMVRFAAWAKHSSGHAAVRAAALLAAVGVAAGYATPYAERMLYGDETLRPPPRIDEALGFILAEYPDVRFLNDYGYGGYIIYKTRGRIPVFIDGRVDSAYPKELLETVAAYESGAEDWEERVGSYGVGGILLAGPRYDPPQRLVDRFRARKGWTQVYKDDTAIIYVKDALVRGKKVP